MPDAFGNPTPQEVIASLQQQGRKHFLQGQASGSPGVQAGSALAAIFGGPLATTIDTRRARVAERDRLMKTQGLSKEQAMEEARATIGRDRAEVRRAKQVQEATGEMQDFVDSMDPSIPMDMRMAQGKLMLSNRMRSMGLTQEANNLQQQAFAEITAAEQAALERENLKSRTAASNATTEKTLAEIPYIGTTGFQKDLIQSEILRAELNDPNSQLSQSQRDAKLRQIGWLEAKMLKDTTITGRTAEDVRNDPTLMRKLFSDLADNQVLINSIDETTTMLDDLDNFETTFWASLAKDGLSFMQRYLGRQPNESEQEFMQNVTEREGKPTLIAAKIRHALTGAQMSAFEIVYLEPFLPSPDDGVEVMKQKMRVIREYTQMDTDTRMQMFQQGLTIPTLEAAVAAGTPVASTAEVVSDGAVEVTPSASAVDASLEAARQRLSGGN